MRTAGVVRVVGLVVLLVAASAIGPLAWGRLQGAFGVTASSKPVVVPISPFRLFDTRPAPDDPGGGPDEPFGQGETRTYQVAGVQGVPADAIGVVLNLTAVGSTAESFVTLYPAGAGRPNASTLNPAPGRIVFNSATVLLGGGKFSVFLNAGSSHLLADVVGYLQDHNHDERYLEESQPIVITESPASFERFSTSTTPTMMVPVGHLFGATADNGVIIMPLTSPNAVGGTQYRLATVEWCLATNTTNGGVVTGVVVYDDQSSILSTVVSDGTDRTAAGCYPLTIPARTSRGFSLAMALTGQTTNLTQAGAVISGVRSTWVPSTGPADVVGDAGESSVPIPTDLQAFLGIG